VDLNLCAVPACTEQPFITYPLPLCQRDALMVSLNVTDVLHANALAGTASTELDIERVSVAPRQVWEQPSHEPVVYFLANGNRVKVGTSTNITARVITLSLRRDNALLLLRGGRDLEDALHNHFASDRISRTEWFVLSGRIRDYIAHRLEAAAALRQPVLPVDGTERPTTAAAIPERPEKPATAIEKIVKVLSDVRDYLHRDQIAALTQVEGSTLDNTLSKLVKTGRIHRQTKNGKEIRGMYGPGPAPITHDDEEDEDEAA